MGHAKSRLKRIRAMNITMLSTLIRLPLWRACTVEGMPASVTLCLGNAGPSLRNAGGAMPLEPLSHRITLLARVWSPRQEHRCTS